MNLKIQFYFPNFTLSSKTRFSVGKEDFMVVVIQELSGGQKFGIFEFQKLILRIKVTPNSNESKRIYQKIFSGFRTWTQH
jgi:hypothetical protein